MRWVEDVSVDELGLDGTLAELFTLNEGSTEMERMLHLFLNFVEEFVVAFLHMLAPEIVTFEKLCAVGYLATEF